MLLFYGSNFLLTGSPIPLWRIDHLADAHDIKGWDRNGLRLDDGRVVMPVGMKELPEKSETIKIATERGVEVSPDGHTYVLVQLWHWCGNDAVRYDLRKLDLAQLLAYHQEGVSTIKPHRYANRSFTKDGGGSSQGWSLSSYAGMKMMFDPKFADVFGDKADTEESMSQPKRPTQ